MMMMRTMIEDGRVIYSFVSSILKLRELVMLVLSEIIVNFGSLFSSFCSFNFCFS